MTEAFDDNKAYFDTTAWLQYKSGHREPTREDELEAIAAMFAEPDTRSEFDRVNPRHTPALDNLHTTTCEVCNLPIHKNHTSPTGWVITGSML